MKKYTKAEVAAAYAIVASHAGRTRSAKKAAAARRNGADGGRPRKYPEGLTMMQREHLRRIAKRGGKVVTDFERAAVAAAKQLENER